MNRQLSLFCYVLLIALIGCGSPDGTKNDTKESETIKEKPSKESAEQKTPMEKEVQNLSTGW